MWLTEQVLFQLVRLFHHTEVAHSSEMKQSLQSMESYDSYRAATLCRDSRVEFVQNTTTGIPLPDQSIDVFISYDAFEHVSQPAANLRELHRILVRGGRGLIGTWSWRHPFAPHLWAVMPVP
jgi:SAM-dependent methyltransferase